MRSPRRMPPGTFTLGDDRVLLLPTSLESAAAARRWLTSHLEAAGARPETTYDAVLVLSELVTNAIHHGAAPIVCVFDREHPADIAVLDFGGGEVRRRRRLAGEIGGRGLDIVDRLTARWGVTPFPGGKAVWAKLPRRRG
jgi:anti-sigma regulatory factor (Ser/Thr protein kinase)